MISKIKKDMKGITLIALVITIIVLLILAGVSIATLTGQNGILTQANNAKTQTTQSKAEELVTLAIGALQSENLGDTSKITPEGIANQVNKDNNRTDVVAEGTSFPTNINFVNDGVKVHVNVDMTVGEQETDKIYSVDVDESEIAPQELFYIETSDGKVASISGENLPTKTAKIRGIKSEYCNHNVNSPDDTFYEINYDKNGVKITDTLIVPYKVTVEGEEYTVTEVSLEVAWTNNNGKNGKSSLPSIENIIYPNTVTKLIIDDNSGTPGSYPGSYPEPSRIKKVVLPENINEIPENLFMSANNLKEIDIPKSVTKIGSQAFACSGITSIYISENIDDLGGNAFYDCESLSSILVDENNNYYKTIDGVLIDKEETEIMCCPIANGITTFEIPITVNKINSYAFKGCISLTGITYNGNTYTSKRELEDVLESNGVELGYSIFDDSGLAK